MFILFSFRFYFPYVLLLLCFILRVHFCTYDNLDARGGGTVALTNGPVRIVIDRLGTNEVETGEKLIPVVRHDTQCTTSNFF